MADNGIESLEEDLTIQRVILDSLESEEFPGVEEEKEDARREIHRLKKLLQAAKLGRQEAAGPATQDFSSDPRATSSGFHELSAAGPSSDPHLSRTMATPSTNSAGLRMGGVQSLPTRKRDYDSSNLSLSTVQPKSRRFTPSDSLDDPFCSSPSNGKAHASQNYDFIDLTGDDDYYPSTLVAEQKKHEDRRRQEIKDFELAKILSSQHDPVAGPSTVDAPVDAFSRIMNSQPPPASGSSSAAFETGNTPEWYSDSTPETQWQGAPTMPGAYDSNWDDPFNSRPAPRASGRIPVHDGSSRYTPIPVDDPFWDQDVIAAGGARPVAMHNPPVPSHQFGFNGPPRPQLSAQPQSIGLSPSYPGFVGPSSAFRVPSLSSSMGPPRRQNGSVLSDIINRTGMFDYVNGVDGVGNPLPEHLTHFIQDAFHDPRMNEKELDDLLQNIRPDMDIPERNRDGTPAGLRRPLYPHQELALTWMKKMEDGTNKGGILADDMGLGKTISTLALLVSRPATSRPKTNLIVAPVALMRQWEEEILTKTKLAHRLSVFVYHNKKAATEDLLKYDVVLTTYGTVAQELKRLEKFKSDHSDRNIDYDDKTLALKCPLLHPKKGNFYRIILDEAQCIKNRKTKTAEACSLLKSTYRWCLTGTPMMNGVLELYSLMNFLRIKPYCKWEEFRQAFGVLFGRNGDPRSVAMKRLRALLKASMLRRKKNSKLDGKPILKLPEKTEEVVYAELSTDERDFYDQLEKKSQVQFSKYLREGTIGKNYSNILVLLLRLRQACCHPHLNLDVQDVAVSSLSDEEKLELVKALDKAIVERIRSIDAFECPICYDAVSSPSFFIPCGHDSCGECLVRLTENAASQNLSEGSESNQAKCPVCRGAFEPAKSFSYELFQKVHMPDRVAKDEAGSAASEDSETEDDDSEDELASDDEADNKGNLKDFIVYDGEEDCKDDVKGKGKETSPKKAHRPKKRKGKKAASDIRPSMLKTLRKEGIKNREAYRKYMGYLRKTWLPSAKVLECLRLLKEIGETGEKTIIFSQWTLLLDLLEVGMWHEDGMGKPERYDGGMSADHRSVAAKNFREKSNVQVMLVSLRAGNAGLNLTAASRVIIMDPFWNPYIEMQAVDRAYRIGQQKEVKVYRILTKDTVEDRIVELQNRKKEMVEAALDENESAKIGRLNVNELKFLFNGRS